MTKFNFCANCANYITNDEIEDMPIEREAAMISSTAIIARKHGPLSLAETIEGENSFRCECCKGRAFGEKFIFAAGAAL